MNFMNIAIVQQPARHTVVRDLGDGRVICEFQGTPEQCRGVALFLAGLNNQTRIPLFDCPVGNCILMIDKWMQRHDSIPVPEQEHHTIEPGYTPERQPVHPETWLAWRDLKRVDDERRLMVPHSGPDFYGTEMDSLFKSEKEAAEYLHPFGAEDGGELVLCEVIIRPVAVVKFTKDGDGNDWEVHKLNNKGEPQRLIATGEC